jgi:hypothetical protein
MKVEVELRPGTPTTSNVGIVAGEGDGSRTEDDDLRVHVAKCILKRFYHRQLVLKPLVVRDSNLNSPLFWHPKLLDD